ncbi:hypothetical protein BSZ32_08680 [Rubritalea profundi]|uniref:Uncharacterized protein n=1 Tax=Rubritalea profundi TaxID=1658618 RepID=A0A2S7U228_9BACT|nr:hypothetical protein BSZ32_08680 [Rubritalea profundi]
MLDPIAFISLPQGGEIILMLMVSTIFAGVFMLPFWMILKKAGLSPALSLLLFVPGGLLVLLFILALSRWPALESASANQS